MPSIYSPVVLYHWTKKHWTSPPILFKPILLLKSEKENTQNSQIKSFGLRHENLLRSFA